MIDHGVSNDLSVGFTDTERRGVLFGVWALKSGREEGERWSDGGMGGGLVIALRWQRLWILSVTGHTQAHTHRLGTQISEQFSGRVIGSLMLILPLQDWLITPAIPFHAAIPPSLHSCFDHFLDSLNMHPPSTLHLLPSSFFPLSFSLSGPVVWLLQWQRR